MKLFNGMIAVILMVSVWGTAYAGTLEDVKSSRFLKCGVNTGVPGFAAPNSSGIWEGMDVDVCRAIAAAVLGDARRVKYTPLTAKERFTALQSGEVDVLSRNTTWTQTRDTSLGLNFAGVNYYDGQGFMVKNSLGVKSALDLDGASVCVQSGTTTELNLADYFAANNMKFILIAYDTSDQTAKGFDAGRCDVLTSDQSQLYALRTTLSDPKGSGVLPEIISKEPLGPVVRQGDDVWFNIVKWSLNAFIIAEEKGLTSANVDSMKGGNDPTVKRLLGEVGNMGANIGLEANWAYNIIKQVGNYGESFERNIGMTSSLKIARGLNQLWSKGGILYAPPLR